MRKKNFTSMGMACLLGCCLMLGSCSSEVDNLDIPKGKGFVKIDLATLLHDFRRYHFLLFFLH